MAALSATQPTLLDLIRRLDPNGAIAKIIERLSHMSPLIGHATFKESNGIDNHKFTVRTALPVVTRRTLNVGTAPTKSETNQVTEAVTILNAQSKIDVLLAELNGNKQAFRYSEDKSFVEAMSQQAEESMLYDAKSADPSQFNGFLTRMLSTLVGDFANQIVPWNTGNSNTNTSMLLVGWGEDTCYGIFPKGTKGGLEGKDMGEIMVPDSNNNLFRALVTDWIWRMGLVVEDARFVAAVRNIDMTEVTGGTIGTPVNDLLMAASDAYGCIFAPARVNLQWYVSRALYKVLRKQAINAISKSTLQYEDVGGRRIVTLEGVPVNISDSISNTEPSITT